MDFPLPILLLFCWTKLARRGAHSPRKVVHGVEAVEEFRLQPRDFRAGVVRNCYSPYQVVQTILSDT